MARQLDDFETQDLLEAVDDLDKMRGVLADGANGEPPQLRTDLMKLHELAVEVCNEGGDEEELLDLAMGIEEDVEAILDAGERILKVLRGMSDTEIDDD